MSDVIKYEQELFGAMMIGHLSQILKHGISSDEFIDRRHQVICAHALQLDASGQIVNPITLRNHLTNDELSLVGGVEYLFEIAQGAPQRDAPRRDFIARLVRQWRDAQPPNPWWDRYNQYLQSDVWKKKRRKVIERCKDLCEGCRD